MNTTTFTRRQILARGSGLATLSLIAPSLSFAQAPASRAALAAAPGLEGVSAEDIDFLAKQYEAALASGKTTVNIYSANAPVDPNTNLGIVLRKFEETFPGITVLGTRISGAEQAAKIEAELASGNRQADLVSGPEYYIDQGLIEPFDPPLARNVPAEWRDPDNYYISTTVKNFGLAYNTDLVAAEELPASLEELLVEKWKGQITIAQPTGQTTIDDAISTLFESKAITADTLKKIAEYVPSKDRQVQASASVNLVSQGRYAFALWGPAQVAAQLASRGAPIAATPFKEAVLVDSAHGLLKGSPSPDAAKLLLNWLFSPVSQRLYAEVVYEYGTVPGSPIPAGLPDVSNYNLVTIPAGKSTEVNKRYFDEVVKPIFGEPK